MEDITDDRDDEDGPENLSNIVKSGRFKIMHQNSQLLVNISGCVPH